MLERIRATFSPFAVGFAVAAALFGGGALLAQTGNPLVALKPIVIDIRQAVPVVAEVALPIDGEMITATLPMTVDVNMQVSIRGGQVYTVTAASEAPPAEVAVSTVTTGEVVTLDGIEWTVIGAKEHGDTLQRSGFQDIVTDGKFIAIGYEVKNTTDDPISLRDISLVDAEGRLYEPSSLASYAIKESERCSYGQDISPGLKRYCVALYDVPTDASGFRVEFTNLESGNDTETQLVPLNVE